MSNSDLNKQDKNNIVPPKGSPLKNILLNSILLFSTLIFILLLAEGAFYILNSVSPAPEKNIEDEIVETTEGGPDGERLDFFQYHSIFGYSGIPNLKKEFMGKMITHNSRGLRGPELEFDKPPKTKRIVFLGDSQMWGWSVGDNETIPYYANEIANQSSSDYSYETINFGSSGYGLDQSYLRLITEGLRYKPDVVVLSYFADNDIWETSSPEAWGLEKPYIYQKEDGFCVSNVPPKRAASWPTDNIAYIVKDKLNVSSSLIEFAGFSFDLAETNIATYFKQRDFRSSLLAMFGADNDDPVAAIEKHVGCLEAQPGPLLEDWQEKMDLAVKLILLTKETAEAHDAEFILVMKPLEFDYRDRRTSDDYIYVLSHLGQNEVNIIELLSTAQSQSVSTETLYGTAGHLSPAGNHLVANQVIGKLLPLKQVNISASSH